jgi:hypothetical protein
MVPNCAEPQAISDRERVPEEKEREREGERKK